MDRQAHQLPKLAGTNYDGELEAIKISTEYAKDNTTDNTKNIGRHICGLSICHTTCNYTAKKGKLP